MVDRRPQAWGTNKRNRGAESSGAAAGTTAEAPAAAPAQAEGEPAAPPATEERRSKEDRRQALETEMVNAGKNDHHIQETDESGDAMAEELRKMEAAALAHADAAHSRRTNQPSSGASSG